MDKPNPPAITTRMSDENDLKHAQAGCLQAFGRIYDRHGGLILSLCRRDGSPTDADDALQEVFIRAHQKLGEVNDAAKLRSWLIGISRRVCSERRRAANRRQRHERQAAMNRMIEESATQKNQSQIERQEQLELLTVALNRLPDDLRLAIHLHYLEPDAPAAASTAMGISRSGFYKLLDKAKRRLATLMKEVQ